MSGFKVNDRVRRSFKHSLSGIGSEGKDIVSEVIELPKGIGTVKALKEETSTSNSEPKEHEVMYQVAWDNGTVSYFGVDGLVLAA